MAEIELIIKENDESNKKESKSRKNSKKKFLNKALSYQSLNNDINILDFLDGPLKKDSNNKESLFGKGTSYIKLDEKDNTLLRFQKEVNIHEQYPLNNKEGCKIISEKNKITISFIVLGIIILILIIIVIKTTFHSLRKRNQFWVATGEIISILLNKRYENNRRIFSYKEDYIEENFSKNLIHICLTFDEYFLFPALVLMTSLLENNNNEKNLIVLHLLLPKDFDIKKFDIIETLRKKYEVKINYYMIPNLFNSLQIWRQTYTIYFKIIIPIIFSDLDRIIFLDTDALVFKDLSEMYNLSFNDNYVLGFPSHDGKYIDLLIDNAKIYINAGVLLVNIKKIREDNKDIELLQYIFDKNEYLTFPEQDAINVVFFGKIGALPLKYGVLLYDMKVYDKKLVKRMRTKIDRNEMKNAIEDPSIVHFSLCNPKVWYPNSKNYYGRNYICKGYYNIFYYYANKTEFYSEIYKKYN